MARELDSRDFSTDHTTLTAQERLHERAAQVSDRLAGEHRIRIAAFDPKTGGAARIVSTDAPIETGHHIQRALKHLQAIAPALGLPATQATEFLADPHVQRTSSDARVVHLRQLHQGIPIFQASQAVRFAPSGALLDTIGSAHGALDERSASPFLAAAAAVLAAAKHVATPGDDERRATDQFGEPRLLASVDLTDFAPEVTSKLANSPERTTIFAAGPFGAPIRASLLWFPAADGLRLAWQVLLSIPQQARFRTIVDAETGKVIYCHDLVSHIKAKGNVFHVDGGSPRKMTEFPRPLSAYDLDTKLNDLVPFPVPLPSAFPDAWATLSLTTGNCVNAHMGDDGVCATGVIEDGIVVFNPHDAASNDQKLLNLFYYNCYIHDYFYILGFREADGNFQNSNFNRGGGDDDGVDARVFNQAIDGTASMEPHTDGSHGIMRMGLVSSTKRHTALDSTVVFHEFTHGVSNRLVGGRTDDSALEAPQSEGMGEGWGDYTACTINQSTVVGAWVTNNARGIRGFPYDAHFPDHFGKIGTGRYVEAHNIGEIWCATLMEMNRNIGHRLAMQLVVDAMKLSPSNPSFLEMRDAILQAFQHRTALLGPNKTCEVRSGIWKAFAKFGMGPSAVSVGAALAPCIPDFAVPFAGEDEIWRDTFSLGWSAFVPFELEGKSLLLLYKAGTGDADVVRVTQASDGGVQSVKVVAKDTWAKQLSSLMPLELGGVPHLLAYSDETGDVLVNRLSADGKGSVNVWSGSWSKGWSSVVPLTLGGHPHYLTYSANSGHVTIGRIDPNGHAQAPLWRGEWTAGWTALVPLVVGGHQHLLLYKRDSGEVKIERVSPDGKGAVQVAKQQWQKGWTSVIRLALGGAQPALLVYDMASGDAKIVRLSADVSALSSLWAQEWTSLWTSVVPFELGGKAHVLCYKALSGTVTIDHVCEL